MWLVMCVCVGGKIFAPRSGCGGLQMRVIDYDPKFRCGGSSLLPDVFLGHRIGGVGRKFVLEAWKVGWKRCWVPAKGAQRVRPERSDD